MFNLRLCNAATIPYSQLKFGQMRPCGMDYKCFSSHCWKCNSFGCTAAIRCGSACHGPIAIASSQVTSTANSIHRCESSVNQASPTHGGRWLAQTNYDALMTHHTTENWFVFEFVLKVANDHTVCTEFDSLGIAIIEIILNNLNDFIIKALYFSSLHV